uniref:Uncharacterized protein n=1 Tax=Salix viminalis TaxID=40686 RepID=A0A6N2K4J4_SALVM
MPSARFSKTCYKLNRNSCILTDKKHGRRDETSSRARNYELGCEEKTGMLQPLIICWRRRRKMRKKKLCLLSQDLQLALQGYDKPLTRAVGLPPRNSNGCRKGKKRRHRLEMEAPCIFTGEEFPINQFQMCFVR